MKNTLAYNLKILQFYNIGPRFCSYNNYIFIWNSNNRLKANIIKLYRAVNF
jgi:hypothetical protein